MDNELKLGDIVKVTNSEGNLVKGVIERRSEDGDYIVGINGEYMKCTSDQLERVVHQPNIKFVTRKLSPEQEAELMKTVDKINREIKYIKRMTNTCKLYKKIKKSGRKHRS